MVEGEGMGIKNAELWGKNQKNGGKLQTRGKGL